MKKRFSEQQIIAILKESESGVPARDICRKHNISDATFYTWRKKYVGMEAQEVNNRLKRLLADSHLHNDGPKIPISPSLTNFS